MASDPRESARQEATGAEALKTGDLLTLMTESGAEATLQVTMISGIAGESVDPMSLYPTSGLNNKYVALSEDETPLKLDDILSLTKGNSIVHARIVRLGRIQPRIKDIGRLRVADWSPSGSRPEEQARILESGPLLTAPSRGPGYHVPPREEDTASTERTKSDLGNETIPATSKRQTPAGKVKASFNLLPEDINSLRKIAQRLGTTVTNVLQRAIRDEDFIQQQLREGNKFAIVNQEGEVREIIWR